MWEGIRTSHLTTLAKHHRPPQAPAFRSAYPVLNMMAQMMDVGITWEDQAPHAPIPTTPEDNIMDMVQNINAGRIRQDRPVVPTGFLRPLWEIGFTELHQISSKNGATLLTMPDLRRRYPDMGVTPKHAAAIRKLGRHIGGNGTYGIPVDLRPPPTR